MAGKTGTTDEETDAWFVGFSNDVTIAVWVGYDNAKKKQTLGKGRTGGNVAVPIFAPIMEAVWQDYAPRTALRAPRDAASQLSATTDPERKSGKKSFEIVEYLRTDAKGKVSDRRYALVSQSSQQAKPRENFQDSFAMYTHDHERSWNWFGGQTGWSGPRTSGPSTSGQGGNFWRR